MFYEQNYIYYCVLLFFPHFVVIFMRYVCAGTELVITHWTRIVFFTTNAVVLFRVLNLIWYEEMPIHFLAKLPSCARKISGLPFGKMFYLFRA